MGASLALHALVLSWLGLRAVQPPRPAPPPDAAPLLVELVRPRPAARPDPAAAPPLRAAPAAPREVITARAPSSAPVARPPAPRLLPSLPSPSGETAPGASKIAGGGQIGTRPAPGPQPGAEVQGDLRGFLRGTVGCSHEEYLRLTPAERARCDAGFATALKTAPPIPLSDDKLAEYARGAEANARKRARREGPIYAPVTQCPPGTPAGNLGLGCLAADASHTVAKF